MHDATEHSCSQGKLSLHGVDFFLFFLWDANNWSKSEEVIITAVIVSICTIYQFLPTTASTLTSLPKVRLKSQHVKILFDAAKHTRAKSINSLTKYRSRPIVELRQIKSISRANKMRRALISESLIKALFSGLCYEAAQ